MPLYNLRHRTARFLGSITSYSVWSIGGSSAKTAMQGFSRVNVTFFANTQIACVWSSILSIAHELMTHTAREWHKASHSLHQCSTQIWGGGNRSSGRCGKLAQGQANAVALPAGRQNARHNSQTSRVQTTLNVYSVAILRGSWSNVLL
jgi:hypothetical protein